MTLVLPALLAALTLESARIASVTIAADPATTARIAPYVELRAGDAYDPSVVARVVRLVHATGEFEDVVVEIERQGDGVAVVLRPLPAPLLAGIEIEGDTVVGAGEVRRIARLREREPLWPARLERAAQDTAVAVAGRGFLEARVTPDTRPVANGTLAVFHVRSGPLVRVARVGVEGGPMLAVPLWTLAEPRRGDAYRRARAQAAAERIRKAVVEAGYWRARVELHEEYDPSSAEIGLRFQVETGPRLELVFRGDKPPAGVAKTARSLLEEGGARGDVEEEVAERIEEGLRQLGHRQVVVQHRHEPGPGVERVVYEIAAGPSALVASVQVDGAPELANLLATRAGAPLQDRLLDQDSRSLTRALMDAGHADARVEANAPAGGGLVPVVFRVEPGPRTLVAGVTLEPEQPSVDLARLRTAPGRPYRARELALDRNDLAGRYRDRGYPQVSIDPEVEFSADRSEASVRFKVDSGPRVDVGQIVVSGLYRTRERVVRRELTLHEGSPLGADQVLESQRRLASLGILQGVNLSPVDPEATGASSLVVAASEAPRTTFAYGVGFGEQELLRGSVEVTRRNLAGMDRSLSLYLRGSFTGSRVVASYREPYLLGRRQELFVTGYREEQARDGFSYIRYGTAAQANRNLSSEWSLILRVAYQRTHLFDVTIPLDEVDRQFLDSTFAGPSASLVNDTRDDRLDPHRGRFLGGDFQLSLPVLGGDTYVKAFLQAAGYHRLRPNLTLALGFRLGLAHPLNASGPRELALPDRFFAGGDYSIRGYQLDTAGPLELSSTGTLVPTGGNALVIGNAELRYDTRQRFTLAVFSDAGNVYPLVSDLTLSDVKYTAGLGLRYRSAVGPLRLDWGYKLNRRPGESPSQFHFTVGNAF